MTSPHLSTSPAPLPPLELLDERVSSCGTGACVFARDPNTGATGWFYVDRAPHDSFLGQLAAHDDEACFDPSPEPTKVTFAPDGPLFRVRRTPLS